MLTALHSVIVRVMQPYTQDLYHDTKRPVSDDKQSQTHCQLQTDGEVGEDRVPETNIPSRVLLGILF